MLIRKVESWDVEQILAIEKAAYRDPWSDQLLRESLQAPMTYADALFDESSGRCLAYAIYQVVLDEAHLLNLAVDPSVQRQGCGRQLLHHLIEKVRAMKAKLLFLEVRPSNKAATMLYEAEGFRNLLLRENYYADGEAALVMIRELT